LTSGVQSPNPSADLPHLASKAIASSQVDQETSYPALAQPLTYFQCQHQKPDNHPAIIGASSNMHPRYAILSHLRHLAASHSVVERFEEQTRDLFRRENAPSPELRLEYPGSEPIIAEQPAAETESGLWTANYENGQQIVEGDGRLMDEPGQLEPLT
jgi:hypothetical protein